jgi:hypothetical protein
VEGDKTMREGENISFLSPELISEPKISTVKSSSSSLMLSTASNVNTNENTEISFTTTLFNLTVSGRQHFVTTDIFERSIESVDIGTNNEEREVQ